MAGDLEVWAKDMEDGRKAVGTVQPRLVRGDRHRQMVRYWGVTGKQIVRDLWRQKDLGHFEGEFSAPVGRHGVVLASIRPATNRM